MKYIKLCAIALATPIILVLLLMVAIYLPPVQNWAVHAASRYASEETGMDVTVGKVRLAFPLDLSVEGVKMVKQNDSLPQVRDTIADIKRAVVDVKLMPLFRSDVQIDEMELLQAKINTSTLIHEARIKGFVGRMAIESGANASADGRKDGSFVGNGKSVAEINLDKSLVNINKVLMDDAHLDIALSDTVPEDTTKTENKWKIRVSDLAITRSDVLLHMPGDTLQIGCQLQDAKAQNGYFDIERGLYDLAHLAIANSAVTFDNTFMARQQKGLDVNHIALNDINLKVDSVHFLQPYLALKIRECAFKEKSGFCMKALAADVKLDSTQVKVDGTMKTPASRLATKVIMDLNAFDDKNPGKVWAKIDASIGCQDVQYALTGVADEMKPMWPTMPLNINGEVSGNLRQVYIPFLNVEMPSAFALNAKGDAQGFMALQNNPFSNDFRANLHADLKTYNIDFLKRFLDKSTAKIIGLPAVTASADVNVHGADYDARMNLRECRGTVNAKANLNLAAMRYNADVKASALNVGHFVKGMQLGSFTGSLSAIGQGTEIKSRNTRLTANADVSHFTYGRYNLNNINADVLVKNGRINADVDARNQLVDGKISLDALLNTQKLDATLTTELNNADLYKLFLVEVPLKVAGCAHVDLASDMKDYYKVQGLVSDITVIDSVKSFRPDDIVMDVLTTRDTTHAVLDCGDLHARLNAQGGYKKLLTSTDRITSVIQKQMKERTIDQTELRQALPLMELYLHCSTDNPIARIIKYNKVEMNEVDAKVRTSKEEGIFADVNISHLATQGYVIDTLQVNVTSESNPNEIKYNAHIQNFAPNDYVFNVFFDGELLEHGATLNGRFYDNSNQLGLMLGAEATMVEEGINFHLTPEKPILGYMPFALNQDNYILLDKNQRIFADVRLKADDGTGIQIYSTDGDESDDNRQDLTVSVNKLNLQRLLSVVPYAPKVEGDFSGDVHFVQKQDESFSLALDLGVKKMIYEGCKIGNLGTNLTYMPKDDGYHYVDGTMTLDGKEIAEITGAYNFDTNAIDADLDLKEFPMQIANGFIPDRIIGFEGTADGKLTVHGTTTLPDVNGELFLQSASLLSEPYGVKLRFDDDPIRIINSKLLLENFQMYDQDNVPLLCMGEVNFTDIDHIKLDLRMRAENFHVISAKENRYSLAYGDAYVNFFCFIRGELEKLTVRGKLDVLPSTNLFYILKDSPLTTDNRMKELVTFTDFSAPAEPIVVKPTIDGLDVNLNIEVKNGSHIKCWLNDQRTNYLDIIGEGSLRMKMLGDEIFLTGRYTINEGEMKYSLPIIPLKTFIIQEGSYLEFTGDMMNPTLHITAKEEVRSSVSINGTHQMVKFYTGVVISKTLNDMGLEFIIESPENQTIADELAAQSLEERGKLAVTMLTTGMYLSDGNTQKFSMNSALNSFLQSEINQLAGNALKTLDLSFGMENSTEEDGTMHTNYAFKFAKRFWNNRLSISVGGKISTGPDVSGQNKQFFDNVEVLYRLSEVSNKYMQLMYQRSVYDFLEGYVGQYGAGFMWKKKVLRLSDLFRNTSNTIPSQSNVRRETLVKFETVSDKTNRNEKSLNAK